MVTACEPRAQVARSASFRKRDKPGAAHAPAALHALIGVAIAGSGVRHQRPAGHLARTPHVASAIGLPALRQSSLHAATEAYVDFPALKQTLHLLWQGMHSGA